MDALGTVGVNLCTTMLPMAAKELSQPLMGLLVEAETLKYVLSQHVLK